MYVFVFFVRVRYCCMLLCVCYVVSLLLVFFVVVEFVAVCVDCCMDGLLLFCVCVCF